MKGWEHSSVSIMLADISRSSLSRSSELIITASMGQAKTNGSLGLTPSLITELQANERPSPPLPRKKERKEGGWKGKRQDSRRNTEMTSDLCQHHQTLYTQRWGSTTPATSSLHKIFSDSNVSPSQPSVLKAGDSKMGEKCIKGRISQVQGVPWKLILMSEWNPRREDFTESGQDKR